jgi:glycosyltransferase involved in cell wall biosynthesis
MRIVVVTTSYPRTDDDPAGHFVRSAARGLARAGHEVHVIAPGGSLLDPPRLRGGVVVHRAGGGALFAWPGAIARAREAPWRLFSAGAFAAGALQRLRWVGEVDRAVAHWIVPSAWPLLAFSPAPLEALAHGADVRALVASPHGLREEIVGSLLDRGTRFVFAAQSLLESLASAMGPLEPALRAASHVDPPPIDVPDVVAASRELRAELALAPGARLAVSACRLVASKRVELAIEATAAARTKIHLAVVGDGPERASLEKRAAALGARVTFTGALPRREALTWVAAADVVVHPSALEAAPTIVREARALVVPVVGCDAGDLVAWAAADPGILVTEPDAAAIARAIERAVVPA